MSHISRRALFSAAAAGAAAVALPARALAADFRSRLAQTAIPRWRGFNLLDLFQALPLRGNYPPPTSEDDFRAMRDWGFNFVRIPMDYWFWIDSDWRTTRKLTPEDTMKIRESAFDPVDRLVDLSLKYGLHISLNLHRAPGFCINNPEREPFVLWSDVRAEDAFAYHWDFIAKRYQSVSPYSLSLNLINEAPNPREGYMSREDYRRSMTLATERIRAVSPDRIVIIDGLNVGNTVVDEMIPTRVAQSVHAYWPGQISHYRAAWVDRKSDFPTPAWPVLKEDGTVAMGRRHLEERYAPWGELARKGIGVHCGEAGCYNKTPHPVFLAWMTDVLEVLESHNIGWALWNLRGPFGIIDSGREDIQYEDFNGSKLDRKLLALLQKY
jgi:aryl-phospho-beta-D-glucosidase BglC (GH1 family)